LTITTSAQDGSAASARTTAAPTCPVPPMIKTRNAIWGPLLLFFALSATSIVKIDAVNVDGRGEVLNGGSFNESGRTTT
jgi:hypothetical protein